MKRLVVYDGQMTVEQLIKELNSLPGDAKVGIGHEGCVCTILTRVAYSEFLNNVTLQDVDKWT